MEEVKIGKINILKFENKDEAVEYIAKHIVKQIKNKPDSNLGLATGKTMIPLYKKLVYMYKKNKINFSKTRIFMIDEYIDVKEKNSFRYYLKEHFLSKVNVKEENQNFLSEESSCEDYEKKIKDFGGIDLMMLGIGRNGHIAFNEPGSLFSSRTRIVELKEETKRVKKKFFKNSKEFPNEALTIGIGTILEAREIILLAFGKEKARAIETALNGEPRVQYPASALQNHKKTKFIVDKFATSKLL